MADADQAPAVFGAFDGLTSALGVLVALAGRRHDLIAAVIGLAVASGVGMAAGEWLSDNGRNRRAALIIGAATAVGTLLPAVGFLVFSGETAGVIVGAVVSVGVCMAIATVRSRFEPRVRAWAETFGIFVLAAGLTLLATVLTGTGG